MGTVGGNTCTIGAGGVNLTAAGKSVSGTTSGLASSTRLAAGAVGDPTLAAALNRFAAAFGVYVDELAGQMDAAGMLASNAANDLTQAGG